METIKLTIQMTQTKLSLKRKDARLQDEKDVVEAWLTKKLISEDTRENSEKYRFTRESDDVLQLVEVIDYDVGTSVEPDVETLSRIAVKLIQKDEAMRVEDLSGLKVAELDVV